MTNRQQSAFFITIFFLFSSGIGLVLYKQLDSYYSQRVQIDLESASVTGSPSVKKSASSVASTTPQSKVLNVTH